MSDGALLKMAATGGQRIFGHICPECGSKMYEVERLNENGFVFVWFECARAGCQGQWLEKRIPGSKAINGSATRPAHVIGVI